MDRRLFVKRSGFCGLALTIVPSTLILQDIKYSIEELMGKEDIELYGDGINLRKEAHDAFIEMKKAASADGIQLKIVSSYRNFDRQAAIFERKYLKYTDEDGMEPLDAIEKIIEYSTIPGTSRHHWGTDIDIIDGAVRRPKNVLLEENFEGTGVFFKLKKWMDENAEKFGFYLVYPDTEGRKGFYYEPWHYSYKPLSKRCLKEFLDKDVSRIYMKNDLKGSAYISKDFLNKYFSENILDINPTLK